ncbi:magnesium transporter MgtC [Rugosibacter aromaticivorans]|uniref:Magnesium transporter MgtC n=1 Tax=Rugosibacter aromaticivorans TaxID=1565605 RepID=A0A0C5J863_9PROT|nr:MgtC/SapB family protein [Rugosibacter aromaticivorans]AJP47933.1 magnesium transporter MgtC [Rugosibacter aromaticivorans]
MPPSEPNFAILQAFATSLGIGLLIGLERERQPDIKAGVRTFALVCLLGCLAALLAQTTGNSWILAAGFISVAAMMITALATDPLDNGDPGTTSVVALLVCYALGAIVWYGHASLAVMLGITTTTLLYFKHQLHDITQRLTHTDILSVLQFGVLSLVILPILPNQDFGPYLALNPHHIWWMVVLISGVSLAGYTALRLVGTRHGAMLLGIFGGLVSSTATTMIFSRHARQRAALVPVAGVIVLLATLVVMVRIGLVAFLIAPTLIASLAPVLGSGLLLGVLAVLWARQQQHRESNEALPMPEISNPTEIKTALTFGALYALILVLSAWLKDIAGSQGLYLLALISGLTDVDAITLSALRLFGAAQLSTDQAVTTITLAMLSNLAFKSGLIVVLGGRALARRTLFGMLAVAIGLIIGLLCLVY